MRPYLAAAAVCLGLLAVAPSEAKAQWYPYYGGGYLSSYTYPVSSYSYYPTLGYYYNPGLYTYSYPYYYRPYVWSGRYFSNPFNAGIYYQRYYPWTNRYYYRYRLFR